MDNLSVIEDISRFNALIEKLASLKEDYGDEYPIIFFEPNIDFPIRKTLKNLIQGNSSIRFFSDFEECCKFAQTLGASFILIFSNDYNEEMVLQGFKDTNCAFNRRMFDFEEEALLKDTFKGILDTTRKSLKVHVFVTFLDAMTERPIKEDEEEVMMMCDIKEMTSKFREESAILWYDPHWNHETKGLLAEKVDIEERNIYRNFEELYQRITSSNNLPYHLILTGKDEAEKIIKEVNNLKDLLGLYIYCDDPGLVPIKNRKVAVQKNLKDLIPKIIEGLRTRSKLQNSFPAFTTHFDALDKSHVYNLHYYLKGLINFKNRKQAREDFLKLAKSIYQSKKILEFEKEYNDYNREQILAWYTQESPVYKLVNNCLRIATSDSILYCRYILKDLETAIKEQYQQESHKFNGMVYRGAFISKDEWGKLERNVGREIEMHGFLSTSKSLEAAKNFANKDPVNQILITIIVPPLPAISSDDQGFAEIDENSEFNEEEILFNVRSKFEIVDTGTMKISDQGTECRHLILLYGAHSLREYMTEWNQSRDIDLLLPPEVGCMKCGSKDRLFGSNQEKTEISCMDCLLKNLIPRNTPFFALDLKKDVGKNEKIAKSFKGQFLTYNKSVSFSNCGYKCHNCKRTNLERYYKWISLNGQEILEQCFECFEKKEKIESDIFLLEESPHGFWLDSQEEWEKIDSNYQFELFASIKSEDQGDVYMQTQQFNSCIEYGKRVVCQWAKKRYREIKKQQMFDKLGEAERRLERNRQALDYFLKSLEIIRVIYEEQRLETARAYSRLVSVYQNLGQYQQALKYNKKTLAICQAIFEEQHPATAYSYNNFGTIYQDLGQHKKALEYFLKALDIRKATNGEQHPETARAFNNLGLVFESYGQHQQALEFHNKALKIRKAIYGKQHPETAGSYNNIGSIYQSLGQYQQSLEFHNKALDIRKIIYGEHHPETAGSYNNLAGVYKSLGQLQKAQEYFCKALDITKGAFGEEEHADTIASYKNLGSMYQSSGEYQKALEFLFKARDFYQKNYGEDHSYTAISYNDIGSAFKGLGEYQKALEYHQKALKITTTIFGEQHPHTAKFYNNLGSAYQSLGKYKKALDSHQKALEIRINIYGEQHPDSARSFDNLGLVSKSLGEYQKALEYHEKALGIRKAIYGEKHPDTAASLNNLGLVYDNRGRREQALEYHEKALDVRKSIYGETHPDVAASYDSHGSVYFSLGEYAKALEYFFKALDIKQAIHGEKHSDTAKSYGFLGLVYESLGQHKQALEFHKKALEIRKTIYGEQHPDIAHSYTHLGAVYASLKKYQKALDFGLKGLDINKATNGEKHPYTATSYNNIGAAYQNLGEYQTALGYFLKALEIRKAISGENDSQIAVLYTNIGSIFGSLGQIQSALDYFLKAQNIFNAVDEGKHPNAVPLYINLGLVYHGLGDHQQAREYQQKALDIRNGIFRGQHPTSA